MARRTTDIVVANVAELATVHVAEFEDGSTAWARDRAQEYVLQKGLGVGGNGVTIIAPIAGSPIAGAPGAVWVLDSVFREAFARIAGTISVTPAQGEQVLLSTPIVVRDQMRLDMEGTISALIDLTLATDRGELAIRLYVDGTLQAGAANAFTTTFGDADPHCAVAVSYVSIPLAAGSHTVELRWEITGDAGVVSATINTGIDTDAHAVLRVHEVSANLPP
jgi:hypothetical protein